MKDELLKGLTEEQIERASQCKNQEELLAIAEKEGIKLTDEQLEAISGGGCEEFKQSKNGTCPQCHALVVGEYVETTPGDGRYHFNCTSCGFGWTEK